MKIENPAALRFIIDDDLYLLDKDKVFTPVSSPVIAEPVAEETPVIDFKYMGGNKKSFLVLVHYTDTEFINDAHLTALTSIFKRLELAIEDVAILNMATHAASFEQVYAWFKPVKLLLMGKSALPKNIESLVLNEPKQLDSCRGLYSFSFDEMMSSNENKRTFWDLVKTL